MTGNPFDQFDAAPGSNPFDRFDMPAEPPGQMAFHGADIDEYFSQGSAGRLIDLFGQGFKEGWGAAPLGLSPETSDALKQAGIFNDHQTAQQSLVKEFNEALIRPAATVLDAATRLPTALYHGIGEIALAVGVPRDIVALPEAFPAGHATGLPAAIEPVTPLAGDLAKARNLGVIGRGEAGWLGTTEMPAEEASRAAIARLTPGGGAAEIRLEASPSPLAMAPGGEPSSAPARDVHQIAREIAPDVFGEYDMLAQQRDALRAQVDALRQPEIAAAQQRIDDILAPVAGVEDRLTNRQLGRLNDAYDALDRAMTADTPEMVQTRHDLMAADERMRDLAPQVSAAYRQADEQLATAAPAPAPPPGMQLDAPGSFGPVLRGAENRWPDAVDWLRQAQSGEAIGVLSHPEVPERIDVIWGKPDSAAGQGYGLAKIVEKHPEVLPDLPERLAGMTAVSVSENRIRLAGNGAYAVIRRDFGGAPKHWLLTAYETGQRAEGRTVRPGDRQADTSSASLSAPDMGAQVSPANPSASLVPPGITADIAGDVARRLAAAGRPADEANAAAAIVAAHYEARAARFGGQLGTPFELYQREGPQIRGRAAGGPGGLAAGRSMISEARTIITLFRRADASTFIHETGHQWLAELLRDAADPRAPQELRDDAEAVRQWAGIGRDEPTRAQHEMFARGFEAYMMEGRAPTPGLAGVFAQFRDWLVAIYNRITAARLPVIDSVRGVYDRLLGGAGSHFIIAPERPLAGSGEPAPAMPAFRDAAAEAGIDTLGTGGSEAAAPTGVAQRQPKTAYVTVPPEPLRLAEFLRKAGGIKDAAGELRARDANRARPGLVNNRSGRSLDDAALQAWEAGYLPEFGERPEIKDLLAALDRDLAGDAVYSQYDSPAAAKFRQALDQNHEVDRLGQELGIDPRDWTREQFWNLVADHLEGKRLEEEQRSLGEALQAEFEEAERQATAWAESRGDAWEPQEVRRRTLEELENEARQEESAGAARTGEGGAGSSGPADGDQTSLSPGAGAGAGGAGSRPGSTAEAEPAGVEPNRPFATRPAEPIDKAGNIRLDNLNQPDDIDAAIRAAAARNDDFLPERRGTLSDGEVLDLAEALGRDPAFLDRKAIGEAFNAEEVLAARRLLIQSATAVRDAMAEASRGGDEAVLALAQAIAKHEMIQAKVAQATAEWGRAGRSFRMLIDGAPAAAELDAFLRENSGRTLYQLREMAALGARLPMPGQVSKFISDTAGGNIRRAIIYYWINALISGPMTHLRYSVGNAVNALWAPLVETPIAAGIGALRGTEDRVYLGEAAAQLYGLMKGSRDGLSAAYEAFRTAISPPLPSERVPEQFATATPARGPVASAIGTAIGVPSRTVAAIHSFFKAVRYEQNIQALAYRQAMTEHLAGDAFTARVAELTTNPAADMMHEATADALKELYMAPAEYDSFAGRLTRAINSYETSNLAFAAKVIMPFLRIGSEITRNAFIERTPLAFASRELRGRLLSGTAGGDLQAAKITAGVGLAGAIVLMTLEGLATGDGPSDPNQRAIWLLSHRPNSITIGNVSIPYQGLGHLGMLMRFAANMTETAQGWQGEDGGKLAVSFLEGATRAVLDENFMRGLKDVLDAVYHPDEYGAQFLRNFTINWLPYSIGLGQVARTVDPYSREQRSILDAARARIPFLSETLPARRDRFGEPIRNGALPNYTGDRTVAALDALHVGIGRLDRKIRGVDLTPDQYDDFARLAGRYGKLRLDLLTAHPGWQLMPPEARIELVQKTVGQAREAARTAIMMQHPDIVRAAIAAKTAKLGAIPQ